MSAHPLDPAVNRNGAGYPPPPLVLIDEEQTLLPPRPNASLDCGWGRLLYAPSFESPKVLAEALKQEAPGRRDIALYVEAPQLVLAEDPTKCHRYRRQQYCW